MNSKFRLSWDEYFMQIAESAQARSNCIRNSVGAVIVKEKRIIATGYNGTPAGIINCIDGGCKRCSDRHANILKINERKDLCICVHAELNAILQSAYHGASTKGATLYCTIAPCLQCAKAIINAGIKEVIFKISYTTEGVDNNGINLLSQAGVKVKNINGES